jgi:hypothetical protein
MRLKRLLARQHSMPGPATGSEPDDDVLQRLNFGVPEERAAAIVELARRFEASGSNDDLNALGLAYAAGQRHAEAAEVFFSLVRIAFPSPESEAYRLSLATTYEELAWLSCSRHQLGWIIQHTKGAELRETCSSQRTRLDQVIEEGETDVELRRCQFERCVERLDRDGLDLAEAERLARLVGLVPDSEANHQRTRHGLELLRASAAEYPDSADLLRGVLHCCLVLRDDRGVHEALQLLDDLEAESSELAWFAEALSADATSIKTAPYRALAFFGPSVNRPEPHSVWNLVKLLDLDQMEESDASDAEFRLAVVGDLRRFAERYPWDPDCCFAYAFGLLTARPIQELASYVDHLATLEEKLHSFHYNYGQLLIAVGERDRGQRHLQLSLELASNQEEAEDAAEVIQRFADP